MKIKEWLLGSRVVHPLEHARMGVAGLPSPFGGPRVVSIGASLAESFRAMSSLGTAMTRWRQASFTGPASSAMVSPSAAGMACPTIGAFVRLDGLTGGSTGRPTVYGRTLLDAGLSSASFTGVIVQIKGPLRASRTAASHGAYVPMQLFLLDSSGAKNMGTIFSVPADGLEHYIYLTAAQFAAGGGFSLGVDTFCQVEIRDRNDRANYYFDGLQDGESAYIGQVFLNPISKGFGIIRFDDGMKHLVLDNGGSSAGTANFLADGSTRNWNCKELLDRYGYRGVAAIIGSRIGTTLNGYDFADATDLATLRDAGWDVVSHSQTHPSSGTNMGLTCIGPWGYTGRALSAVNTGTDVITAAAVHGFLAAGGSSAQKIRFSGAPGDLPGGISTNTAYWARYSTTSDFTVHTTEQGACANTGKVDLTSSGTPANVTWSYYDAVNDSSAILADIQACEATLVAAGIPRSMARMLVLPQGGYDAYVIEAILAAGYTVVGGTLSSGTSAYGRSPMGEPSPGGAGANNAIPGTWMTVPGSIQTDSATLVAADMTTYVNNCCTAGLIFSNYHHGLSATNGPKLAAYLDALAANEAAGKCVVGTYTDLDEFLRLFTPVPSWGGPGAAMA